MSSKLPIVENISYSSLTDLAHCPKYYQLVHIKRLKAFSNNVSTVFGSAIGHQVEQILFNKTTIEEAVKYFKRLWNKFCKLYKVEKHIFDLSDSGVKILENLKSTLQSEFGNFEVLAVEHRLKQSLKEQWPQTFKGFIDIVIKLENGNILIADFKTTDSAFWFLKNRDAIKDYQLVLYKHFFSKEMEVDVENVDLAFILLEKNKYSKQPVKIVNVSAGKKKIQNALDWMNKSLTIINKERFIPNRAACYKYGDKHPCVFLNSEHCPKSY